MRQPMTHRLLAARPCCRKLTPVPIHPAGPVTSLRWRGRLQFRGGDVTLLVTPGFPVPQPMALYHLDSDILIIILQQLHNFATLWNIRRVCLARGRPT
eukprot:3893256-Prymnesium_polylepis.1